MNLKNLAQEFVWAQKYRPKTIDDCILPEALKTRMKEYVNHKQIPSFVFHGTGGIGKTSLGLALCEEIGAQVLFINGSEENGIDVIRNKIKQFASSSSLDGKFKVVFIDEADYLNAQSAQPAMRSMMEEFSKNCSFILTCNFKHRLLAPILSRCTVVDFKITNKDKPELAKQFFRRVTDILKNENVEFDPKVVAQLITKHFPDFRQTLYVLQDYSVTGPIDSGILVNLNAESFKDLFKFIKEKNFTEVRKWVATNSDAEPQTLFRELFDNSKDLLEPPSIPQLVLVLADYQYKSAFVVDQEINTMACLTEVMHHCKFKG